MLGHELTLHETNARGAVAVCGCGWYGVVHPAHWRRTRKGDKAKINREPCVNAARAEHSRHLLDQTADIAARSDRELARIGAMIPLANATLQRRGRWGHS